MGFALLPLMCVLSWLAVGALVSDWRGCHRPDIGDVRAEARAVPWVPSIRRA